MLRITKKVIALALALAYRYFLLTLILIAMTPRLAAAGSSDIYCHDKSVATAVDLSQPVTRTFLTTMKAIGVRTIIRYYDHKAETLPGKTLHAAERQMITGAGFELAVVFQHWNNRFSSFTPERGRQDGQRSLMLAEENDQSKGSAIYFGVDGPWRTTKEIESIKEYFASVNETMKDKGYRVGVYGSGLICEALIEANLATLCWLSNAKGWPNYARYYESKAWALAQTLPIKCGGIADVDFNILNGRFDNFGQFGP